MSLWYLPVLLYHQPKNQQQGSDTKSDAHSVTLHQQYRCYVRVHSNVVPKACMQIYAVLVNKGTFDIGTLHSSILEYTVNTIRQ